MDPQTAPMTIAELCRRLDGELRGDGARPVARVAPLHLAGENDLSWLGDPKYLPQFQQTRAAAVLVARTLPCPEQSGPAPRPALILVADPDVALCDALRWFAPPPPAVAAGVHPTAVIEPGAELSAEAGVGPHVFVGRGARVGPRTQLHANVYVGAETTLGADCVVWPGVVIRERITLGDRVIVHANATLGADGFGFLQREGRHIKIPHVGTIVVEDDVEIGAGTCIDRAKSGVTRIGRGTKIDNLVQIAHNADIGHDCVIVAQCGISGSTTLGPHVVLGGQVGLVDHLTIGARARVAAQSGVTRDLAPDRSYVGFPAIESREFWRGHAELRKIAELRATLRGLLKRVEQLESAANDRTRG